MRVLIRLPPVRRLIGACLCVLSIAQTDSHVPPEVRYKSAYVNNVPKPTNFTSAMLWGIAIADTRTAGYQNAVVSIARTELSCRVNGKDIVLNDDRADLRGGLYRRFPWFGTDAHGPMPIEYVKISRSRRHKRDYAYRERDVEPSVVLRVGANPDRAWHFWAASPRVTIPAGNFEGCTVKVRAKISQGALLQVGFDYWRDSTVGYGSGGNNHEAGASDWYFPSDKWQDTVFSDVKR